MQELPLLRFGKSFKVIVALIKLINFNYKLPLCWWEKESQNGGNFYSGFDFTRFQLKINKTFHLINWIKVNAFYKTRTSRFFYILPEWMISRCRWHALLGRMPMSNARRTHSFFLTFIEPVHTKDNRSKIDVLSSKTCERNYKIDQRTALNSYFIHK